MYHKVGRSIGVVSESRFRIYTIGELDIVSTFERKEEGVDS